LIKSYSVFSSSVLAAMPGQEDLADSRHVTRPFVSRRAPLRLARCKQDQPSPTSSLLSQTSPYTCLVRTCMAWLSANGSALYRLREAMPRVSPSAYLLSPSSVQLRLYILPYPSRLACSLKLFLLVLLPPTRFLCGNVFCSM
jgi:hypothetical protein